jgi:hypothetical protein
MHVAAGIGYEWGVKALLDANAKLDIKDKMNRSVVEYAEQKKKWSCAQDIREAQAFAPFMQEGDQTSPEPKGLSQVVHHQVQWLLYRRLIREGDIFQNETVMGYLRSSDTCQLLSVLKDYEKRCPSKAFEHLEQVLHEELAQGRILNERTAHRTINGSIAEHKPAAGAGEQNKIGDAEIIQQLNSFYRHFNPTRAGMAENSWNIFKKNFKENSLAEMNKALAGNYGHDLNTWKSKTKEAKPETKISDGKEEASKRATLCSTRGLDWLRDSRPIAPKLLMMSYDEASVMLVVCVCVCVCA